MDRYRTYTSNDDSPLSEGDTFFTGVNGFDSAENLKPGQVQAAVNIDFSLAGASTRGGFVCLPQLGAASFNISSPWTSRSSASDKTWTAVAYGNGRFVAVNNGIAGTNDVMYSTDSGVTWNIVSTGFSIAWSGITYGNGLFVAVGGIVNGNNIMTSPDGVTWTRRTSPVPTYTLGDVVYSSTLGLFVAVVSSGGTTDRVVTSPDAITWTNVTTPNNAFNGVSYGNGVFVAVGNLAAMSSPDGTTWTTQTIPNANWKRVAFNGTVFCAVATNASPQQAATTADGVTWTSRTTIAGALSWQSITYGNGQFFAVNSTGTAATAIMSSPNGITWTAGTAPTTQLWNAVGYGNGTFVAAPQSGGGALLMTKSFYTTPNTTGAVLASGVYSDPNSATLPWTVLVGTTMAGFYAFGQTTRTVSFPGGVSLTKQSTVVQANNILFIFPGTGQTPLQWTGDWSQAFTTVPASTLGVGYTDVPQSNQATYVQNRLWAINGKDTVSASQALDFKNYNVLTGAFNLNIGSSDYLVTTYPFGDTGLVVFKNRSIFLLSPISGALTSTTNTEITRQLGIIGINACVTVGPDIVYMSDRNISSIRLNLQNNLQSVTEPLSRNIPQIIQRVNWAYAYKVSMGFWNNQLFIALPLDNSTVCNTIVVYNFITQEWYGEWSFAASMAMAIQGFVINNYLGQQRLHVVTEDGRILVYEGGQNDISGTTVAEISSSLTTRAYRLDNSTHVPRRMYADISTNRPSYSITAYADGANESTVELSAQTYSRSNSWLFNDSTYNLTNSNDDYNRAFRQDYSSGPASVQCGSGFLPEMTQNFRIPLISRRKGRLSWYKIANTTGFMLINGMGMEARPGDRGSLTQVG